VNDPGKHQIFSAVPTGLALIEASSTQQSTAGLLSNVPPGQKLVSYNKDVSPLMEESAGLRLPLAVGFTKPDPWDFGNPWDLSPGCVCSL